ncbi:hypothetical protein BN1058_01573 [Paraliobacillus sp. PM-2]|uniref:hypothetical protein n=1 Tax=Paraliobacillus sp. PM-2 TaxID=1462524 RepID=UPI00061C6E0B|nr:hypothetical protein [Paraliobacillus sp. PM-2]CQR47265.1 hypothetical protein BN1058_01573 [Paraliobacillus sp. PM-2]
MFIAYSLYIVTFIVTFLVSYYYINYATVTTTIRLHINIVVASVMQLSIYSLSIFGWFLYTFPNSESHVFIGLQLGYCFFLISEVCLIGLALYKFKRTEMIHLAKHTWRICKKNYLKIYKSIRS